MKEQISESGSLREMAYQEEAKALREDLARYVLETTTAKQVAAIVSGMVEEIFSDESFRVSIHNDLDQVRKAVSQLYEELLIFKGQVLQILEVIGNRLDAAERASPQFSGLRIDAVRSQVTTPVKGPGEELRLSSDLPEGYKTQKTETVPSPPKKGEDRSDRSKGTQKELIRQWQ